MGLNALLIAIGWRNWATRCQPLISECQGSPPCQLTSTNMDLVQRLKRAASLVSGWPCPRPSPWPFFLRERKGGRGTESLGSAQGRVQFDASWGTPRVLGGFDWSLSVVQGSSVVVYKNASIRKYQIFACSEWPGGLFGSPTLVGSRPGVCCVCVYVHVCMCV